MSLVLVLVVVGNSNTATKLQNLRNIKLQGAVTGNANFDGSRDITISTNQNNIATITGSVSIEASSTKVTSINYPSDYSDSNCIPIAIGVNVNTKGYNYAGFFDDSQDLMYNAYKRHITLGSSNMSLYIKNPNTSSTTFSYKIVLMKIS